MSIDAPNHEKKRIEKRQANLPVQEKKKITTPRCGCGFSLIFFPSNNRYKTEKSVFMNNANFRHSNSCHRSSHMLLQQHVLSGSLTWNGESQRIITALLEMMRYEDHVDSKTVRNILK